LTQTSGWAAGTRSPASTFTSGPTVSLVIPTVGPDEVLLVGDGPCPSARLLWEQFGLPGRYVELPGRLGSWGHGVRNYVNDGRLATGQYLMALDDDDVLVTDAVAKVRRALRDAPGRPHLFRLSAPDVGVVLWRRPELKYMNVGAPLFVCPNDPARLGRWGMRYGGDYDFIKETCDFYPHGPVWRPEIICEVRQ
jgi:hypothetical protein